MSQTPRPDKTKYYLEIAAAVARRSTCLRRQYGAIIVAEDAIVATGYNGARGALRAVSGGARGGERDAQRKPGGHAGRDAVSGGLRKREAAGSARALPDVPANDKKRADCPRDYGGGRGGEE